MQELVIYGAATLARLAYFYAKESARFRVTGFVVDDAFWAEPNFEHLPVWKWSEFIERSPRPAASVHIALGYRKLRERRNAFDKVQGQGLELANIISERAYVASDCVMGQGNLVLPGCVIESGTHVQDNNVFWSNTTVCHDGRVGSHNFIAANTTLGGHARIGSGCFLGFSSVVLQNLSVADDTLIGAGSMLRHSIDAPGVYVGAPALWVRAVDSAVGVQVP